MATTLYADENKARGFRLAGVVVATSEAGKARARMRELVPRGAYRVHFVKESSQRRRTVLAAIASLEVALVVVEAPPRTGPREQRSATVTALVNWACAVGADRIVLERDENSIDLDRRIIDRTLGRLGQQRELEYVHLSARSEPLLWIADAVAWSWARGGEWRDRVEAMGVTRIDA